MNAKVTFKPAVKEPVRRPLVALDDSDEEKDDEVEHGKSGRYSIGGSVKVASNNVRFSKETFEDMKRKGRNFVGEVRTYSPNHLLTHSPNHLLTHSPR